MPAQKGNSSFTDTDGRKIFVKLTGMKNIALRITAVMAAAMTAILPSSAQQYPDGIIDKTVAVVGNEEAKLEGMKGNFHIGGSIYAGPVLIVGDNGGEDFTSLTPKQAERYMNRFAEPEEISAEEAQTDMGITFIGFNY